MNKENVFKDISNLVGDNNVKLGESMALHTTFKIGGDAAVFVTPETEKQIVSVIEYLNKSDIGYAIIGNGSNLLVSDDGFDGVIVQLSDSYSDYEIDDTADEITVRAEAGVKLVRLGTELANRGITGFEFATGIPGCVGGGVRMNAGAYGGEFKDILVSARLLTKDGQIVTYTRDELELGYRTSIVAKKDLIVLEATFSLKKGDVAQIKDTIKELANKRREKQPLEFPSAGSTFKRPEGYFAGKLIEDAGLKGYEVGGAKVSDKHAGFVINKGGATAKDVCMLTDHIIETIRRENGVTLELEVVKLGF